MRITDIENRLHILIELYPMMNKLRTKQLTLLLFAIVAFASCKQEAKEEPKVENVLLQEWVGSYGGVPAFDLVKLEDVKPAMLKGM